MTRALLRRDGWLLERGDAGPLELVESFATKSSTSSSSNEEEESEENEGDEEEVDIIGDLDMVGDKERWEREMSLRGAHPNPYLFYFEPL